MEHGSLRTSAIVIASGERTTTYRTLAEVPRPLRKQLVRCTGGGNCATLVIADQEGARRLLGRRSSPEPGPPPRGWRRILSYWAELTLSGALGLLLWLLLRTV